MGEHMSRQLIFTVVESPPTNPFEAYWDGTMWQIMDRGLITTYIKGTESLAVEGSTSSQGGESIAESTLLKALAIVQQPELITKI
jgi:hypothetical protein